MKIRNIINYTAFALPLLLAIIGLLDEQFYIYALLSTAVTGAIQVLIALSMISTHSSGLLYIYFTVTALFFLVWYFFGEVFGIFAVPPILAIFLTYIIYTERKKEILIDLN